MGLMPHDLLGLKAGATLQCDERPSWVDAALVAAPWVVVRRGATPPGRVAVGIRGATRDERCAAFMHASDIAEAIRPRDLVAQSAWVRARRPGLPAIAALAELAPVLNETRVEWGIAGGVGFELATGFPALGAASDLDLVVRPPPSRGALQCFLDAIAGAPVRVDVLVETPAGAVALEELLGSSDQVLLRTARGPRLLSRAEMEDAVA